MKCILAIACHLMNNYSYHCTIIRNRQYCDSYLIAYSHLCNESYKWRASSIDRHSGGEFVIHLGVITVIIVAITIVVVLSYNMFGHVKSERVRPHVLQ